MSQMNCETLSHIAFFFSLCLTREALLATTPLAFGINSGRKGLCLLGQFLLLVAYITERTYAYVGTCTHRGAWRELHANTLISWLGVNSFGSPPVLLCIHHSHKPFR